MPFLSQNFNIKRIWTNNFGLCARRIILLAFLCLKKRLHFNDAWLMVCTQWYFQCEIQLQGSAQSNVRDKELCFKLDAIGKYMAYCNVLQTIYDMRFKTKCRLWAWRCNFKIQNWVWRCNWHNLSNRIQNWAWRYNWQNLSNKIQNWVWRCNWHMPMQIITGNTLSGALRLSDNENNDSDDEKLRINYYVFFIDVFVFVLPPPQAPTLHT